MKARRCTPLIAIVVFALVLGVRDAQAWSASGHRITARVAQVHLTPEARAKVMTLTGGRSLALLSTWPDFIRSNSSWDCAKPWHFVTVEDGETLAQGMARPAGTSSRCSNLFDRLDLPHNVVAAIDFFAAVVAGNAGKTEAFATLMEETDVEPYDGSTQLTALAFLVHFVGDVHQPLHVGRGGDRGGNSITTNWFGEIKKLHAVWDGGLIDGEGLSYTEFAEFLDQEFDSSEADGVDAPSTLWAEESIAYRSQVYEIWTRTDRTNYLPDLSYDYSAEHIGMVKERLYHGGLRLAALLNSMSD